MLTHISKPAWAGPLSIGAFDDLASHCAPSVSRETLAAVAKTESDLDPWALHDNTTGVTERPTSAEAALSDAVSWIGRGQSVDLGLMQINSANLAALGMTVRAALDPCASLAGGAAVLQAAYGGGKTDAEQQAALLMALSRYNTGSPFRGIMNGYARKVMANDAADLLPLTATSGSDVAIQTDPNMPPAWNIWATASYAQTHGAPWLILLAPDTNSAQAPVDLPANASPADTRVTNKQADLSPPQMMRSQ